MLKRLKYKCWNCKEDYELTLNLGDNARLSLECPFCSEVGVVDLAPYRQGVVNITRGDGDADSDLGSEYRFPAVLPTERPPAA